MLLCHRGCGLESTFTNYLGEPCCAPRAPSCPVVKKKSGERSGASRKGKTYEELYGDKADSMREVRSAKSIGRIVSAESRRKSSITNKNTKALNPKDPWNKGKIGIQIPWNKGLRGYSMPARRKISEDDYKVYQRYKRAVYSASRKTYNLNKVSLNPDGNLLGRCGVKDAYQIDHVIPISIGYELKIPVTSMSIVENLQIMPCEDNLKKSNKHTVNETLLMLLLTHNK